MMRKIILGTIIALLFAACANGQNKNKKETEMKTIEINKEQFLQKVVNYEVNSTEWKYLGDKPAIIDFYASWCGPCKMLGPVIDQLAEELEGKIPVGKIDVDECREVAMEYGVMSIPTVIYFKNGLEVKRFVGVQTKEKLLEAAKELE